MPSISGTAQRPGGALPDIIRFRSLRGGGWGGVAITILLHGALVGVVLYSHRLAPAPAEAPRDLITTELVKLGRPREKFWLPRLVQPARPKAPVETLKVADNPNAAPAPKTAPRPEDADISKDLKRALNRAKLLQPAADEPDEGSLTGSAEGTSNTAREGDEYDTAVATAIKKNWSAPAGLMDDAQLAKLSVRIRIRIGEDGTISDVQVLKSSGNPMFDASAVSAVKITHAVPPPPAQVKARYARGIALGFEGSSLR